MPLHTALCELIEIQHPILQAPIGGLSTPALVAAVSNAGGLGLLSVTWRKPEALRNLLRETRSLTSRPFGVNLVLAFDIEERLDICLDEGVRIISFFWGDPARYIPRVHTVGGLVLQTVGSASQARSAVDVGADIIVAQGVEAGGHVCGEVGTMALVPRVVDAVPGTPVVAAGGIADGRGIAAVLCLGAAGAMLGTRFVMSREANAHPDYQAAIAATSETGTAYLEDLFDRGWRNAPHRALKNSTYRTWMDAGKPNRGARPAEDEFIATLADGGKVPRYSSDAPTRQVLIGLAEAMALYAGQGAGLIGDVRPAGEIVSELAAEAQAVLRDRLGYPLPRAS
jgi:nitronate monooxygenase